MGQFSIAKCMVCPAEENSVSWSEQFDDKIAVLRGGSDYSTAAETIDALVQRRQDFIEKVSILVGGGGQGGGGTANFGAALLGAEALAVMLDLVKFADHLHILLPDLARRILSDVKPAVSIISQVAPKISAQYRAEQTDLFRLENMRRLRYDRENIFADKLEQETGSGEEGAMEGGMVLAKCPAGCKCGR